MSRTQTVISAAQRGSGGSADFTGRVMLIGAGALVMLLGARRGGLSGLAGIAAGATLLGRGSRGQSVLPADMNASAEERRMGCKRSWSGAALVSRSITILRPREEVYQFWRNLENLPRFLKHIERIDVIDDKRSHWVVRAPFGRTVEWDSIIVEDVLGERIAWKSAEGADVRNEGRVTFRDAPGGRGTEVRATIIYEPPAGQIGRILAKLTGEEPELKTIEDLRRLKQLLETGEIATPKLKRINGGDH